MAGHVSDAVIRRLPGYYRHLRELESAGVEQISSQELGERMHLTPSQIRQDINCFGGFGRQGYGYKVSDLKMHIGEILGLDREHTEIIVGAGNIGCAIAKYPTFQREGFRPLAMFDNDPEKIGVPVGDRFRRRSWASGCTSRRRRFGRTSTASAASDVRGTGIRCRI